MSKISDERLRYDDDCWIIDNIVILLIVFFKVSLTFDTNYQSFALSLD